MALEPFLVNPPVRFASKLGGRRSLLAFGLNPRRKISGRKKRRSLSSKGLISLYTVRTADAIARAKADPSKVVKRKPSGSYQVYVRRQINPRRRKGVTPPWLKKFLFKKGSSPRRTHRRPLSRRVRPVKGATPMRHRKKHRRNPVVLGNPRRKHSRRSRRHRNPVVLGNPRRGRRHSYRRNPGIVSKLGLPPMNEVLFLGLGAFAGRIAVPQVLARVPFLSSNPIIRGISRLGMVAIAGMLAKTVLKQNSKMFTLGMLANQVPEAVNDFLSLTGVKLSDGNAELELYTVPAMSAPTAGGLGLYTLSDGDESNVI